MSSYLDVSEQLEKELSPEPVMGPAVGSVALHGGLIAALVLYGVLSGLFHHNFWGNQGAGGAMQVSLVSNALPLPADQPVNKNVLTTETPSQAPAPPAPKEAQKVDQTAIPIPGKQVKPKEKTTPKTQQHQPTPPQNKAAYGEQSGTVIPRAMSPQAASNGPTSVGDGDFASRFGYYVEAINRKMAENWYKSDVDQRTPRGARVFLIFTIHKDGSPSDVQLDRSSGSPTLDISCERGVQRVDTFGTLPPTYNQNSLKVSYYCEY